MFPPTANTHCGLLSPESAANWPRAFDPWSEEDQDDPRRAMELPDWGALEDDEDFDPEPYFDDSWEEDADEVGRSMS
jgi:hypothetical protein